MDTGILTPVVAAVTKEIGPVSQAPRDIQESRSFDKFMEDKLASEREEKNMLGISAAEKKAEKPTQPENEPKKRELHDDPSGVVTLVQQFLNDLKELSSDPKITGGQWSVEGIDEGLLEQLALATGMTAKELSQLREQFSGNGDDFQITDFMSYLISHIDDLAQEQAIKVEETNLPFLQSLLTKMGIPADEVAVATEMAVTGDDKLDLTKLLAVLDEFEAGGSIPLSDFEIEQLQNIFKEAGVSENLQQSIFGDNGEFLANLDLDRLKQMLAKGLEDVHSQKPQLDVPEFLDGLDKILAKAGISDPNNGWSPMLNESKNAIYQELQKIVDLATVRAEKAEKMLDDHQLLADERTDDLQFLNEVGEGEMGGQQQESSDGEMGAEEMVIDEMIGADLAAAMQVEPDGIAVAETTSSDATQEITEVKTAPTPNRPVSILQQQIFDQVSKGIFRGLANNEHHLVLRLQPPELGEVKVDLLVKDDQITVSFAMENSKVKEVLESSMQQFKDSLEQRGFVLEQCFVSVGDDNDPNESWKKFENFVVNNRAENRSETLADLPEDILYHRINYENSSEDGINLFV